AAWRVCSISDSLILPGPAQLVPLRLRRALTPASPPAPPEDRPLGVRRRGGRSRGRRRRPAGAGGRASPPGLLSPARDGHGRPPVRAGSGRDRDAPDDWWSGG